MDVGFLKRLQGVVEESGFTIPLPPTSLSRCLSVGWRREGGEWDQPVTSDQRNVPIYSLTRSLTLHLSCVSLHFCSMCVSFACSFASSRINPTCQRVTVTPSSLYCTSSRISCVCTFHLPIFSSPFINQHM